MTRESVLHLGTENGVQASRLTRKDKLPMTDRRLEMILHNLTKNIVIVMSFFLAGKVLPEADIFKTGFILLFTAVIIWLYLFYSDQHRND